MSGASPGHATYGQRPDRHDVRPAVHPGRMLVGVLVGAVALLVTAALLPGIDVSGLLGALLVAVILAGLNALVMPLRDHPHVGFVLARTGRDGPVVVGARGAHDLADGRVEGDDPLLPFSEAATRHLVRADGFANAPDLYVNGFYDPELDEGCAFEELISFHGGLGGLQTRPFLLAPVELPLPSERVVGAEAVHTLLLGWRTCSREAASALSTTPGIA